MTSSELKTYKVKFEYTDSNGTECRGSITVLDLSWEQVVEQVRKKFSVETFDRITGRVINE